MPMLMGVDGRATLADALGGGTTAAATNAAGSNRESMTERQPGRG